MNIPFLDLKRQYAQLSDDLEPIVINVLRSGAYIGGRSVEEFEDNMQEYLGVRHVVSCANGTDALMIALRAYNVNPGDEVITTPFTFFASAEAIAAVGATPVFVDVHELDFTIDPLKIECKITEKTKAIMPVHIFGWPCNMDMINQIAQKHGLKVIEDAAQAIGSEYKGSKIGASNNLASFSFYPTKNLGAFGDAGMITTNDDQLAVIVRALREHGMGSNGAKARELLYGIEDEFEAQTIVGEIYNQNKYYNHLIGYNSRLDAIQAAILNQKLKHLDGYNAARQRIAELYENGLKDIVKTPDLPKYGKSCYHQYAIRVNRKKDLVAFLSQRGIGCGDFYPVPLHLQKAFDSLGYKRGDFPIAELLTKQTVCLPIFPELTYDEAESVIRAVRDFEKED